MTITDLTTLVIVVAILLTVVVSAAIWMVRRLRRKPREAPSRGQSADSEGWFFVHYAPPDPLGTPQRR